MISTLFHWTRLSVLSMKPFRMIVDHAIQLRFMLCYYVMAQEVNRLCAYCWLFGDLWTPYKLQNAKYSWSPDRHMWAVWRRGCELVGSELAYSSYMHKIVLILKFEIVLLFLISSEYMNIWKWQFQYRSTRYISSVAEPLMSLQFASSQWPGPFYANLIPVNGLVQFGSMYIEH